jgi:YD repeat-containing protein
MSPESLGDGMRSVLIVVFALLVLHCALSGDVMAQSGSSCFRIFSDIGNPLPGAFNCVLPFTGIIQCDLPGSQCPPVAAPIEHRCPDCEKGDPPTGGHPISLATGNTFIVQTDVKIPGISGGLTLVRTWNSLWPSTQTALQTGMFGPNWRSTFEERVFIGSDNYIKYARGDGNFWSFAYDASLRLVPAAPANISATLTQGSTYWTLTFQNGEQRLFNTTSGSLTAIIDRNGNTTQLSYDSLNRLVTVTDPASRHLTFTYASSSSYLVTGVSSDVGLSLTYSYDTQGRLIQVTNPDLSTLNFTYNSQSLITAVTDTNGKVLESHTYDSSGRGLTSARAGGVEALTLTYPNPQ